MYKLDIEDVPIALQWSVHEIIYHQTEQLTGQHINRNVILHWMVSAAAGGTFSKSLLIQ